MEIHTFLNQTRMKTATTMREVAETGCAVVDKPSGDVLYRAPAENGFEDFEKEDPGPLLLRDSLLSAAFWVYLQRPQCRSAICSIK